MTGPRRHGDRGTTLVDVMIGLALTTMAGWLIANLLTTTAERTAPSVDGYDLGLAADAFTRDVREADRVEVDGRDPITTIDLPLADGVVRWEISGPNLTRRTPGEAAPRVMATDLGPGSSFGLRDATGAPLDPGRADDVRWCTRLVVMDLSLAPGPDETDRNVRRSVALRVSPKSGACE